MLRPLALTLHDGIRWQVGQANSARSLVDVLAAGAASTKHIFANMGDGTYYHSGLLEIRAADAANVDITF